MCQRWMNYQGGLVQNINHHVPSGQTHLSRLAATKHEAGAMLLPGMPIFLGNYPQIICDQILWLVKNAHILL